MRVASYKKRTACFGRSPKFVLWLQGCRKNCPGCVAPEWQDMKGGREMTVNRIVKLILTSGVEGVVISGGEPLEQYHELVRVMAGLNEKKIGMILYTGFCWNQIRTQFPEVIDFSDAIVSGPYIEKLNRGRGLMGSTNQQMHFLTQRYQSEKESFKTGKRMVEIEINSDSLSFCGIPPINIKAVMK